MYKLLLLAPFALSACNSGGSVEATNATAGEVAEKVAASAAAPALSPGRWEGTATITDIEVPGLPPEAAARVKGVMATGHGFANCLTPEEARKPGAEFFAADHKDCTYERFRMANGRLDAKMQCKGGGMTVDATMTGRFSSDDYQMTMTTRTGGKAGAPGAGQTMTLNMAARRTGDCTGTEGS